VADAPSSDGPAGTFDALRDALGEVFADALDVVRDAEVPDAIAGGDAGTCACPQPPESTFSLSSFDRGRGPEAVNETYSTAGASASPALRAGPAVMMSAGATFYLADESQVSLSCSFLARPDRTLVTDPRFPSGCVGTLQERTAADGGGVELVGVQGPAEGFEVLRLTETEVEVRTPRLVLRTPGGTSGARTIIANNLVVRTRAPSARFLTPPRAFRP
jgi:hypothetical protein